MLVLRRSVHSRWFTYFCISICMIMLLLVMYSILRLFISSESTNIDINKRNLHTTEVWDIAKLYEGQGVNKTIIISFIDSSYYDMAVNFVQKSLRPNHITNFLFVSQSETICQLLLEQNVGCALYSKNDDEQTDTSYRSTGFRKKMNTRAFLLLQLLQRNHTLLLTDVDVLFMKDPRDLLEKECEDAEICALDDLDKFVNAGFMKLTPTKGVMNIIQERIRIVQSSPSTTDQDAFNRAIQKQKDIKLRFLSQNKFVSGRTYFNLPGRHFFDSVPSCPQCVVIHNNWIVSNAAKIYRFKENLLWENNKDNYYSQSDKRYIVYDNPLIKHKNCSDNKCFKDQQFKFEKLALKNAFRLGKILNRTVILPRFHCKNNYNKECALNEHFSINDFDKTMFNKYRENSFLFNRLTPKNIFGVHNDEVYLINDELQLNLNYDISDSVSQLKTTEPYIDDRKINQWFSECQNTPILKFHSLYFDILKFHDPYVEVNFELTMRSSLRPSNYMQNI